MLGGGGLEGETVVGEQGGTAVYEACGEGGFALAGGSTEGEGSAIDGDSGAVEDGGAVEGEKEGEDLIEQEVLGGIGREAGEGEAVDASAAIGEDKGGVLREEEVESAREAGDVEPGGAIGEVHLAEGFDWGRGRGRGRPVDGYVGFGGAGGRFYGEGTVAAEGEAAEMVVMMGHGRMVGGGHTVAPAE